MSVMLFASGIVCGAGATSYWLRQDARAKRQREQQAWIAERMTRASVDLATHSGQSLADVERALSRAMMMGPHGAPWMRR